MNNNADILFFSQKIELQAIKYKSHIKLVNSESNKNSKIFDIKIMSNPNFGVFDIETFIDLDSNGDEYSRVYALGFITKMRNISMYYLTDFFKNTIEGSNKLVLKCLDDMLVDQYHNFIFYVHNLGKFDVVFLYKILLDYNLIVKNKYILQPLYRNNQIIRLTVKLNNNKKEIKISFVDSLNLLNNSLEKLCNDYKVDTVKGIFPYSFVNKENLNYVGITPSIFHYPDNTDLN